MNLSQITMDSLINWIVVFIIVIFLLIVIFSILLKIDQNKAPEASKKLKTNISPEEIEKASTIALKELVVKINDEYETKYIAHLKMGLSKVDATFQKNITDSLNEFNSSLTNFRNESQKKIDEANQKMMSLTQESDKMFNQVLVSRKNEIISKVDANLSKILVSYLNNSLEGSIDLNDQQDLIFNNLEKNKLQIIEDIKNVKI